MKKIATNIFSASFFLLLVSAVVSSCSKSSPAITNTTSTTTTTTTTPKTTPSDTTSSTYSFSSTAYALVWSDEFNGNTVDTTKWNFETANPGVNNEKEYYQAANATVSNGSLVITAKNESQGGWPYTSAKMNTVNKVTPQYGRIEARIKLPLGQGLWPAFWMLGTDFKTGVPWPNCGEIDIMEHVNADSLIYGTIHWLSGGNASYGLNTGTTAGGYHVYAVEWTVNAITWYVDDKLYCTANIANNINNTNCFHNPFYIILNLAVAGDFPGQTVDISKLPASMYVDYVRVYKAN